MKRIALLAVLLVGCGRVESARPLPDAEVVTVDPGAAPEPQTVTVIDAGPDTRPDMGADSGALDTLAVVEVGIDAVAVRMDAGPMLDTVAPIDGLPVDVRPCEPIYCSDGYQRIIFDPSSDDIYCIPVIGTDPPKLANPCGSGQPYDYHPNGVVRCFDYCRP